MKHFIKFIIFSVLVVAIAFFIHKFSRSYSLNIMYSDLEWVINTKGCNDARAFDFDEDNNLYIAFKDKIKIIKNDSKEVQLINNSDLNIYDIIYDNNNLIISTDNRVLQYDLEENIYTEIINNLPNEGLNKEIELALYNNCLYISIGSNTNSGVVEREGDPYDIPTFQWVLSGEFFGENKTGAFSEYSTFIKKGEKINEAKISSGSLLKYDLNSKEVVTYASGIRNIKGIAFNSDNDLLAIVGGMEYSGIRPISNDSDYIYKLREKHWYGWPDFSGGDPINSERFSDGGIINKFLILNHPSEVPYGPIYQHFSVSSLKGFAIDTNGEVLKKDNGIFADNKENYLYELSKSGVAKMIVDLGDNSYVEQIKSKGSAIYVLDSKAGNIYKLQNKGINSLFNLPKVLWVFLIIFILVIIVSIVYKVKIKEIKG